VHHLPNRSADERRDLKHRWKSVSLFRQLSVVEAPEHRVEVVAADPCALEMEARRLEDPQVRHVVEDRAGREVEEFLNPRGLVQLARGGIDAGVEARIAVSNPRGIRAPGSKER